AGLAARPLHTSAPRLIFPFRRPFKSEPEDETKIPDCYVNGKPIADGQGYQAIGLAEHFERIRRNVNIRRRVPSRFTQMVGGRRARTFSIHFERGSVEREWNQGGRLGVEPFAMMRRKMKNFPTVEDAEAFALSAGWKINSSNPGNMRFNPRVGGNRREFKQRYEFAKDSYMAKDSGKGAQYPQDPHSSGTRGTSSFQAKVTKRVVQQE
uniref:NDUFS4 n=1 Tax=Euglena gracilis TaxID=3039 RepID=UPI002FE4FAEE